MNCRDRALVVILSGPSGVGKDAVIACLKELRKEFHFAVTATTRSMRNGEVQGQNYFFLDDRQFQRMLDDGELLEYAEVYGHRYGVPRSQVEEPLARGQDVLVKTDVQGAATFKKRFPDAVLIFLAPPSLEELSAHLQKRRTESESDFRLRLGTAEKEMKQLSSFDYVVVNHEEKIEEAVSRIDAIITAEKCRVPRT